MPGSSKDAGRNSSHKSRSKNSPDPEDSRSQSQATSTSSPSEQPSGSLTRGRPFPKRYQRRVIESDPDPEVSMPPLPWREAQQLWINDPNKLAFAVKSAQIGYSTATAAWAVGECVKRPGHLVVFLSRSEPQSKELARKAKMIVSALKGVDAELGQRYFKDTMLLEHTLKFPNNSRIIALSSNPETARGYTGDVVLDEFAFHPDSAAIFAASYRQVTLGYRMRILSTPNGQQGKFYEMAKQFGLDYGLEPAELREVRRGGNYGTVDGWSLHWCDIHRAVSEGFPVDPEVIRLGCDEETWLQEFCCQFVSTSSQWIPPELFNQCCKDAVVTQDVARYYPNNWPVNLRNLYAGWDIARHKDLSVIWLTELIGDVSVCRGVVELSGKDTVFQTNEARRLLAYEGIGLTYVEPSANGSNYGEPSANGDASHYVDPITAAQDQQRQTFEIGHGRQPQRVFDEAPIVQRMCIDTGAMGLAIYESLLSEFGGGQVEGVSFTLPNKERMAVHAKRKMENQQVKIPDLPAVRNSFRMIKKMVTSTGNARFDAAHDPKFGHGDHWWAFCLAEAAARGVSHGLVEYWGQQVSAQQEAERQAEEQLGDKRHGFVLAEAQAHAAANSGIFGAEHFVAGPESMNKVQTSALQKPVTVPQTPRCPSCKSTALAVYAENMKCANCGATFPRTQMRK
jgi:phage FluMu gp28-like protein